jgi:hypothetical protein
MNAPAKQWLKPPLGWVKLTCDGSIKVDDGTAGDGMVLRDDNGSVIFCDCCPVLAYEMPSKQKLRHVKKVYGLALY